jgi:hypothetical protein
MVLENKIFRKMFRPERDAVDLYGYYMTFISNQYLPFKAKAVCGYL